MSYRRINNKEFYFETNQGSIGVVGPTGPTGATGTGGAITLTGGQGGYHRANNYTIGRHHQPLYDQQIINGTVNYVEFFQEPIIPSRKELVQVRQINGQFGGKKTIYHPQKRSYAETNMENPGYINQKYVVTGLGLAVSGKQDNIKLFTENSYLKFIVSNKEYLVLPTDMLLSVDNNPSFTFSEPVDIHQGEGFIVNIQSEDLKISSPLKVRCILTGYYTW